MRDQPLVSVVIPSYNHAAYVIDTIRSVIKQSYENIELIIIDDGSLDDSVQVIQTLIPFCEERFSRFEFRCRKNKGLSATLNEAISWCQGEFYAPVASDDILDKNKTKVQVEYMLNNPLALGVFGGVKLLDNRTGIEKVIIKKPGKYNFKRIFLHEHILPAPTQLLRLESVRRVGGHNENLAIEDWSMWLSLTAGGGTLDYISTMCATYRRHDKNMSADFDKMQKARLEVLNLYHDRPLYKKAVSRTYMAEALDLQSSSFYSSIRSARKSIALDFSVLFSSVFLKYVVRFFI